MYILFNLHIVYDLTNITKKGLDMFRLLKKFVLFLFSCIIFIAVIIGLIYLYARYIEPNLLITNSDTIDVNKKTPELDIVLFSDTHVGKFFNQERLEKVVDKINKENPDIVLFAGDFFDVYSESASEVDLKYISRQLSNISSKYGKFAIWGNRDYGGGASRIYEEMLTNGGFNVLKNKTVDLPEINTTITGLDDYLLGQPSLPSLADRKNNFNIVLSHAPDIIDDLNVDDVDLFLAGHSHGGQVYIPFLSKKTYTEGAQKYIKGQYEIKNERKTKLFVTKGIGVTKIPFRFLNVPEVVSFKLK